MLSRTPRRSPDAIITQARSEIEDGAPSRRRHVATIWIARVNGARDPLMGKMAAIAAEFRAAREAWTGQALPRGAEPHADQEDEERSRRLKLGGVVAVAFELILTIYVSVSFLNFYWLLAGLIGVVIAVLLALLVESTLVTSWNPELPRASVRAITTWVWRSFWISLVGIGALLIARTNPWLAPAADVALAVLSLALPVLAGSFFVLAYIYGRFGRLERIHDRLREQVTELDQLLRELRRYVQPGRAS